MTIKAEQIKVSHNSHSLHYPFSLFRTLKKISLGVGDVTVLETSLIKLRTLSDKHFTFQPLIEYLYQPRQTFFFLTRRSNGD